MPYTIDAPLPPLRDLPKQDVKAYFEWFLSLIQERMQALPNAVNATSGFEAWCPDYTPTSLELLGKWFACQVATRKRTQQEIAAITAQSRYPIEIPQDELTNHTFAVAHDVGIYFAEVLRHQYPSLQWKQVVGSKNNIDFGRAALSGFGKVDFTPVHIAITLAYAIAAKKDDGRKLRNLYDVWVTFIKQ